MATPDPLLISVVVPVFNEVDNVAILAQEIIASLHFTDSFEIIFVDDGSFDDTLAVLKNLRSLDQRIRLLAHDHNYGQSTALVTGIKAAHYPLIATLDGDGQNNPADIYRLVKTYYASYPDNKINMVSGNRRKKRQDNWLRRLSSRVANRVRSGILHDETPDSGCGLKIFARADFIQLPYFDHMHRFLAALFIRMGGHVASVDIDHRPRQRGQSKYGLGNRLWVGIVDLFGVWWLMRRSHRPSIREIE